jgi:HrpA-like RNA helicase
MTETNHKKQKLFDKLQEILQEEKENGKREKLPVNRDYIKVEIDNETVNHHDKFKKVYIEKENGIPFVEYNGEKVYAEEGENGEAYIEIEGKRYTDIYNTNDEVVKAVKDGKVMALSSDTGSGKTLSVTTNLAANSEGQVLVLVPRRFLAENAAQTVAELSGYQVGGDEVGYAIGKRGGKDESKFNDNTKLLFATYGYAIKSGLINTAKTIVLDEVHEANMDVSLSRALIHKRFENKEDVKLLEMSATLNVDTQINYWRDVKEVDYEKADGKTQPCERIETNKSIEDTAIDFIQNKNRQGILIFRPGKQEIKDTIAAIKEEAKEALTRIAEEVEHDLREKANEKGEAVSEEKIKNAVLETQKKSGLYGLEIAEIHGEMDHKERQKAIQPPKSGCRKILVGTNVIESGANIKWADSGITCGTGKQKSASANGAVGLKLVDLEQWRLEQQEGRVKRFQPGIFALCSYTKWRDRPIETRAEIERLPITELVMECAKNGIHPEELKFDYMPDKDKVIAAINKLTNLGLIDENFKLTKAGRYTQNLPVSPESAAMIWNAKQNGSLGAIVPLISVMETGNIRRDFRKGHGLDNTSDASDDLEAFKKVREIEYKMRKEENSKQHYNKEFRKLGEKIRYKEADIKNTQDKGTKDKLKKELETLKNKSNEIFDKKEKHNTKFKKFKFEFDEMLNDLNVGFKRFNVAKDTSRDIWSALVKKESYDYLKQTEDADKKLLAQNILAGQIDKLFKDDRGDWQHVITHEEYDLGNSSAVSDSGDYIIGDLRTIHPKHGGRSFTIIENITKIDWEDILEVAKNRPDAIKKDFSDRKYKLFGKYSIKAMETEEIIAKIDEILKSNSFDEILSQFKNMDLNKTEWEYTIEKTSKETAEKIIEEFASNIAYCKVSVDILKRINSEFISINMKKGKYSLLGEEHSYIASDEFSEIKEKFITDLLKSDDLSYIIEAADKLNLDNCNNLELLLNKAIEKDASNPILNDANEKISTASILANVYADKISYNKYDFDMEILNKINKNFIQKNVEREAKTFSGKKISSLSNIFDEIRSAIKKDFEELSNSENDDDEKLSPVEIANHINSKIEKGKYGDIVKGYKDLFKLDLEESQWSFNNKYVCDAYDETNNITKILYNKYKDFYREDLESLEIGLSLECDKIEKEYGIKLNDKFRNDLYQNSKQKFEEINIKFNSAFSSCSEDLEKLNKEYYINITDEEELKEIIINKINEYQYIEDLKAYNIPDLNKDIENAIINPEVKKFISEVKETQKMQKEIMNKLPDLIIKETKNFFKNPGNVDIGNHGTYFFNSVGKARRKEGYQEIAKKVMRKLYKKGFIDKEMYYQESSKIKDKIINMIEETVYEAPKDEIYEIEEDRTTYNYVSDDEDRKETHSPFAKLLKGIDDNER